MAKSETAHQEKPEVTQEMIEQRAYELSQREDAGTAEENWQRAERELRAEPAA
jgi:hypothetical protein